MMLSVLCSTRCSWVGAYLLGWNAEQFGLHLLAGLESGCVPVAAVHALGAHHHGCGALILLRVTLLPHAKGLHREPVLLHLHSKNGGIQEYVY